MAYDPLYWQTSLALNFEGADGSTTFTDISPTPKTPSVVGGDAQISDGTTYKSGTGSMHLDGTGDYIEYADHADFQFGSEDFCIEFWFRPTAGTGVQYCLVMMALPTLTPLNTENSYNLIYRTTGKTDANVYSGSSTYAANGNVVGATGVWQHIAMVREGAALKTYINGTLDGSVAISGSLNAPATQTLRFGLYTAASPIPANGYFDGLRITKGNARYTGNFFTDSELFEATPAGTASAALTAPAGSLSVLAGVYAALPAPAGVLTTLSAARADLSAPMGQLSAAGHDSTGERAFTGIAPMGELTARAGIRATASAPMGTLVASVTVPISVRAELVGPMGDLVGSGTVSVAMRADLRLSSAGTIEAYSGGQATLEAPMGLLGAIATIGVLAHFAGNAPMGRLVASGTAGIVMRAELTAPMLAPTPSGRATLIAPMGFLTAVGRAVITTTYEAYVVNLQPGERMPHQVTRYDDAWDFDHVIRWRNRYYGVKATGMYLLGADLDGADPIAWTLQTGMSKMGSNQKKTCRESIVYGRVGAGMTGSVTIRGDDTTRKSYDAIVQADEVAEATRIKYGRGIKAVYWSFGLADPDGGPADIDSLQLDAAELSRKVF